MLHASKPQNFLGKGKKKEPFARKQRVLQLLLPENESQASLVVVGEEEEQEEFAACLLLLCQPR